MRTHTDAGKSVLRIDGRDALKQLIYDVETNRADFSAILVYDASRWGHFQDADESAYTNTFADPRKSKGIRLGPSQ